MLLAMQMRVSDLQKLLHRLEHIKASAVPSDGGLVHERHTLRFLEGFIKDVDAFDKSIIKKGIPTIFNQNLDDEVMGKVALNYESFVIEISHRNADYSVLFSDIVVRYLNLRGYSITDSSGKTCILKYSFSHQISRPYNVYIYDPSITRPEQPDAVDKEGDTEQPDAVDVEGDTLGKPKDRTLADIQRDILHVLSFVMGILKMAPKSAQTTLEENAESSEYEIYDRQMFDGEKFNDLSLDDQPSFEEWAANPEVVQKRYERNEIRRRMNWRVDDGTAKLEGPLSDPFLSVSGT
jgi:hypothetical protein